ncbi:hypothetical protein [Rhizomicrobium electricum]|uniref:Anti-sigma factor n=1 Tax=Rhizomicrobium electricum TaxID=480070 RepID=A0ABN1F9V2_9PROT|nr:hypothetical protein [Rhizomicrobium electricum]NIJ50617.1 hypothetical protein [Rhizomicrobium electricum]
MSENDRNDAQFARDIFRALPTTAVPAGLEARILADFDRLAVRRPGWLGRFGERLWPGAPAWQPASILALSLAVGLMAGVFVPSPTAYSTTSDQVVTAALDSAPVMDFDKDP